MFFNGICKAQNGKQIILSNEQKRELQNNIAFYEMATVEKPNYYTFKDFFVFFLDSSYHLRYKIDTVQIKLRTDSIKLYSIYKNNFSFVDNKNGGYSFVNFGGPLNHYYLIGISNSGRIYYISGNFCKNLDDKILLSLCYSKEDFYKLMYWNYQLTDVKVIKKFRYYTLSAYSKVLARNFRKKNLK